MSELKAISSGEIYDIIEYESCYRTDDLYYPKSEVDKVIADLEESHKMEVKQLLILNREQSNAANRLRDNMEQAIRHQKYKRCLAMAKLAVKDDYAPWNMKWYKRWLELAEKFKPNSTAQQGKGKQNNGS